MLTIKIYILYIKFWNTCTHFVSLNLKKKLNDNRSQYDTALETQNKKFEPRRSEGELATSRSRRLSILLNFYQCARKKHFVFLMPERGLNHTVTSATPTNPSGEAGKTALVTEWVWTRDLWLSKQAALTTAPGPPPYLNCRNRHCIYIPMQPDFYCIFYCIYIQPTLGYIMWLLLPPLITFW